MMNRGRSRCFKPRLLAASMNKNHRRSRHNHHHLQKTLPYQHLLHTPLQYNTRPLEDPWVAWAVWWWVDMGVRADYHGLVWEFMEVSREYCCEFSCFCSLGVSLAAFTHHLFDPSFASFWFLWRRSSHAEHCRALITHSSYCLCRHSSLKIAK